MIERLVGTYVANTALGILIDVNGVGYGVEMPLSGFCHLPPLGTKLELWIHTYVREDSLRLFGFWTQQDRMTFDVLLSLSGVGPKMALALISTLSVNTMRQAVIQEKSEVFEVVSGIGKRMAEKILLELKPKLKKLQSAPNRAIVAGQMDVVDFPQLKTTGAPDELSDPALAVYEDVQSALENLGFNEKVVTPILKKLRAQGGANFQFPELMKAALLEFGSAPQRTGAVASDKRGKSADDAALFETID